jgi:hypothetical protein
VFRRRRSDNAVAREGSDGTYPAADEASEDEDFYPDDDEDEGLDEDEGYEEDEAFDEDEAAGEDEAADEDEAAGSGEAAAGLAEPAEGRRGGDRDDLGDPATWTRLRDTAAVRPVHVRSAGPWDSAGDYPEAERVDLGCLLVPAYEGADVRISFAEETGVILAVVSGESALQLQAFAAPRSSGLWEEVLPEIAQEVAKAGGHSQEQEGPFGPELMAWVSPEPEAEHTVSPQALRFMGVDGPRWFLRGLISGPAAIDVELARPLEDVFAGVVVVRGDHAAAPKTPLDISLPQEAAELIQTQMEAEQAGLPNPFERGPEITETR